MLTNKKFYQVKTLESGYEYQVEKFLQLLIAHGLTSVTLKGYGEISLDNLDKVVQAVDNEMQFTYFHTEKGTFYFLKFDGGDDPFYDCSANEFCEMILNELY